MRERVIGTRDIGTVVAMMRKAFSLSEAKDVIEAAMGEEVVRCSDCAHASSAGLDCDPDALYCVVIDTVMSPNGLCSFGDRREAR